jgi:hypothetical protein
MQELIVAIVVVACSVYAVWSLMPAAWRGTLRRRMGRAPGPAGGCGGCGGCAPPPRAPDGPGSAVIKLHRRPPSS